MPATEYDILIERRSSFTLPLLLTDATGAPYNLSGITLTGQVRRFFDDSLQAAFTYSVLNSGQASVSLSLTTGQTAAIDLAPCIYDIFMDTTSGSEKLLYGVASIGRNATQ